MNLRPVWPYNESIAHKTKQQQESVRLLLSIHPWFKLLWRGMTGNQCLFLGTSSPKPGFVWAWTLMRWFPKGLANSNAQASLHGTTVSSTGFLLNQHYLVAVFFSIPEYKNKSCSWEEWEWTQEKSREVLSSNLPQDCNTLPSRQPVINKQGPSLYRHFFPLLVHHHQVQLLFSASVLSCAWFCQSITVSSSGDHKHRHTVVFPDKDLTFYGSLSLITSERFNPCSSLKTILYPLSPL